jgi:predicted DNA-binding protein with PD1-like motif
MKYLREGNVIIARLFRGEELIESVKSICKKEHISSGRLQAIGAVQEAILGYFDPAEKKYIHFECNGELVSCMGNIAKKEDEIIIHAHAVIADRNGNCKGGHIVEAEPSVTVELFIDIMFNVERTYDAQTDLYLLDL